MEHTKINFRSGQEIKGGGSCIIDKDKEKIERAKAACRACGNYNCSEWCKNVLRIFNETDEEEY